MPKMGSFQWLGRHQMKVPFGCFTLTPLGCWGLPKCPNGEYRYLPNLGPFGTLKAMWNHPGLAPLNLTHVEKMFQAWSFSTEHSKLGVPKNKKTMVMSECIIVLWWLSAKSSFRDGTWIWNTSILFAELKEPPKKLEVGISKNHQQHHFGPPKITKRKIWIWGGKPG